MSAREVDGREKTKHQGSRVVGTRLWLIRFEKTENPPKISFPLRQSVFYGNRGDEILTRKRGGEGFFPEVCTEWENESEKAREFGARVVMPRIGVVLTKEGGAIEKMLTPFKFGVGGTIGSGEQYMSWITLDDLIRIIHFALENENLNGAVMRLRQPVKTRIYRHIRQSFAPPDIIPVPAFGLNLLFGEMGETLLLEGARVLPKS